MAVGEQIDIEWSIGDGVLAEIAAGKDASTAKREASQAARRDQTEITFITRTCEAFPAERRHEALPYAHHSAVLSLADADRDSMLKRAVAEGWSSRMIRRQVVSARVASGDFVPLSDDDPEDKAFRSIAQSWNRAPIGARELFAASVNEANLDDIEL